MEDRVLGEGIAKQELDLIFVIDNSGSMEGEKIGAVNNAIRDVLSIMPEIEEDNSDAKIKIMALTFSDDAKWVYDKSLSANEFKWKDIGVEGATNLSKAYDELTKKLSKVSDGGMMPEFGGLAPIIILMSDGLPTSKDWEVHLAKLKGKGWFKVALKYALSIEIDSDEALKVLREFTGNPETVLKVYSAEALRKVIEVIAVTASKVKSDSTGNNNGVMKSNNEIAMQEVAKALDSIEDVKW